MVAALKKIVRRWYIDDAIVAMTEVRGGFLLELGPSSVIVGVYTPGSLCTCGPDRTPHLPHALPEADLSGGNVPSNAHAPGGA